MKFTVLLEGRNGHFIASLVGAPNLSVMETTRAQAIAALKAEIQHRIELGELLELEIDLIGVSNLAGKYQNDPTLREICDEAYRRRDAETQP